MRPSMPSVILSRRMKIALSVVGGLIVLLILFVKFTSVYINYLWFGEVHHRAVYATTFWTRVTLFFVFGTLMALIIGGNMVIAYLLRPPFPDVGGAAKPAALRADGRAAPPAHPRGRNGHLVPGC